MGLGVTFSCLQFLSTGSLRSGLNDTFIVLIPKVKALTSMGQLHLRSLCNVLYKIIAKVLTNRYRLKFINHIPRPNSFSKCFYSRA